MKKELYYGDNLDILRDKIASDSVDLCYIDPPFNSKRNYNLIYNNIENLGGGAIFDRAQSQAFVDTWEWSDVAQKDFNYLIEPENINSGKIPTQTSSLIRGLAEVIGKGDLMAYLVSMAVRIIEIHRVLKPTGSFYLHCDQTASHYLKMILDSVFVSRGGIFINEIVWAYRSGGAGKKRLARKHDSIFFYSKSNLFKLNVLKERQYLEKKFIGTKIDSNGRFYVDTILRDIMQAVIFIVDEKNSEKVIEYNTRPVLNVSKERMGLDTQKPLGLLKLLLAIASKEGDIILDAFCGCGTTIVASEQLKRQWIGIDISYQQVSLIYKRLYDSCPAQEIWKELEKSIKLDGVPRDILSARALANKKDDRLRKEFEKWSVLTYSENKAIINDKKGADGGIDGHVYFYKNANENYKAVFQVKSGNIKRGDIAQFDSDRRNAGAEIGFFITLDEPTKPMIKEVMLAGKFHHPLYSDSQFNRIEIITIDDILQGKRMSLPMSPQVLKKAEKADKNQMTLDI